MKDIKLKAPLELEEPETFSEKCAGYMERIMGSWTCVFISLGLILLWISLASYSFIIQDNGLLHLNLCLSCISALEANILLIADKRQSNIDRRRAQEDFVVNQHSEEMLQDLHKHEEDQDKRIQLLIDQNTQLITYIKFTEDKDNNV